MSRKLFALAVALVVVLGGYVALSTLEVPTASAVHKEALEYRGTIYVAGMGGHFAKAEVVVDPGSPQPIQIVNLDRVVIGTKKTHPTHDPRIDVRDRNIMFWSTYKLDPDGKVHVGKTDLRTGQKLLDIAIPLDERAKWKGALYCGSGQSKKYYIPVTMTDEAYIDVFDKKTLKLKHRVFLDKLGYKSKGYKFFHGTNTPDMKRFVVAINLAKDGKPTGNIDLVALDMKALVRGKVKVVAKNKVTGSPGETLTFRQTFTPDGKYLLQSGADRFYVLDGETLELVDEELMEEGQNHDAIPTPDGKYAILTLRVPIETPELPEGKVITDGALALYDIRAKRMVGAPPSVCYACHKKYGIPGNAVLCGADVNWQ